jgi:hypothetical protein
LGLVDRTGLPQQLAVGQFSAKSGLVADRANATANIARQMTRRGYSNLDFIGVATSD